VLVVRSRPLLDQHERRPVVVLDEQALDGGAYGAERLVAEGIDESGNGSA
jgi:hypothetical protein